MKKIGTTYLFHQRRSAFGRFVSGLLSTAMVITSVPVAAYPATEPAVASGDFALAPQAATASVPAAALPAAQSTAPGHAVPAPAPPAPPKVKVNRTVPSVRPVPLVPKLSDNPTDRELFRARVFEEPLVPVGSTSADDNRALADAIRAFVASGKTDDLGVFEEYLKAHEASPWRASVLMNLGLWYRHLGRFSKAVRFWDEAWQLSKGLEDAKSRAVADRAVSELMLLRMRFAQVTEVEQLLGEVKGRTLSGAAKEYLSDVQETLFVHRAHPEQLRPSGPYALDRILKRTRASYGGDSRISSYRASQYGVTLTQVARLADEVGLKMQMAYRTRKDVAIPIPSVAHLELGHFVPVVGVDETGERYLLDDPIVSGQSWMKAKVLAEETSDYFLIPEGPLPEGWRKASEADGNNIVGRCDRPTGTNFTTPNSCKQGGNAQCCSTPGCTCPPPSSKAMPVYAFHSLRASLNIVDTPVGYSPPRGPAVNFTVTYNQREATQPQIFTYSNLGPRWTFDYLSYIADDTPSEPMKGILLHVGGGGAEKYDSFDGSAYAPNLISRAIIRRTSVSPLRYERLSADGSIDVYAQPESGVSPTPRVFLTESIDPTGAKLTYTYDEDMRLVAITDAIGQVTTISYENAVDPLKITKVTDPFGRFARFEYDATGALIQITDVIGMSSEFTYDGDFITSMTTPYGTTRFRTQPVGTEGLRYLRTIEAEDPLGGRERLDYEVGTVGMPQTEPASVVPMGFESANAEINSLNTYYWDKRAMEQYAGDYSKAYVTRWLTEENKTISGVKHSEKKPLENRVWYAYEGGGMFPSNQAPGTDSIGTYGRPSVIARVLDDGSSQIYRYEYNRIGNKIRETDPVGRTTVYVYDTNDIDLLQVKQVNGQSMDLLASYTYNDKHRVLTMTDAAGQTSTFAYYPDGKLHTFVLPPHGGFSEAERTTTYAYDSNGLLTSVTRAGTGNTTSYEYDGYARLWKVTDPEGYIITAEYDALDRPTKTTYPDGTYQETVYDKLDAAKQRDRMGRLTETFYDALRRPIATRDPAGRTTQKNEWVSCASGCGGGGGKLSKLIDANGNATTWEYDIQGRVAKEIRANNAEYNYTYENTTSRLKSVTDPKGNVRNYTYNLDDTLKDIVYAEAAGTGETSDVHLTYEPAYNRLATISDGTGTTQYSYQPVTNPPALGTGQLASVDGPLSNDTITYGYDELGRVTAKKIGGSSRVETQAFDGLGRLATLTNPLGTFMYTYEELTGRTASVTYPNGQKTTYAYFDNLGDHRLQEIHHKKPGGATLSKFNYTYDKVGNILTWTHQTDSDPANVYEFGYDPVGQLTAAIQKSTEATPQVLKRYYYAYDPAGNRIAEQIDDAVKSWTYNNINQLVTEQSGGALIFKGTVNEPSTVTVGGKPATVTADGRFAGAAVVAPSGTTDVQVTATDYATPNRNTRTNTYQVSQSGASKTFTFDANGNMTSDGSRTYEWDAENRLIAVKEGANTIATYTYNLGVIRTSKTVGGVTTTYFLDGNDVVEERLSTGGVIKHFQGFSIDDVLASQDGSGTVTYYTRDHLGSIREYVNASGSVTLRREYDAWGNPLSGQATGGWAFTGREWEPETGLYYYRARYYDPRVGRFISNDPIGLAAGTNRYEYVRGCPTSLVDPEGLAAFGPWSYYQMQWCWRHPLNCLFPPSPPRPPLPPPPPPTPDPFPGWRGPTCIQTPAWTPPPPPPSPPSLQSCQQQCPRFNGPSYLDCVVSCQMGTGTANSSKREPGGLPPWQTGPNVQPPPYQGPIR